MKYTMDGNTTSRRTFNEKALELITNATHIDFAPADWDGTFITVKTEGETYEIITNNGENAQSLIENKGNLSFFGHENNETSISIAKIHLSL